MLFVGQATETSKSDCGHHCTRLGIDRLTSQFCVTPLVVVFFPSEANKIPSQNTFRSRGQA